MEYILVITCLMLVAFVATGAIVYSLRKQRDAAMQEVATISQRLTNIEKKLEREDRNHETSESRVLEISTFRNSEISSSHDTEISKSQATETPKDLSAMTDEELFQYITRFIKEQELYPGPTSTVLPSCSISRSRQPAWGQPLPRAAVSRCPSSCATAASTMPAA